MLVKLVIPCSSVMPPPVTAYRVSTHRPSCARPGRDHCAHLNCLLLPDISKAVLVHSIVGMAHNQLPHIGLALCSRKERLSTTVGEFVTVHTTLMYVVTRVHNVDTACTYVYMYCHLWYVSYYMCIYYTVCYILKKSMVRTISLHRHTTLQYASRPVCSLFTVRPRYHGKF